MRKLILTLAMVFVIAGCSAESPVPLGETPGMSATQTTAPQTISNDPDEEVIIRGYIKAARQFLDRGVIDRDTVTVELIQSELTYVDADQAEAIRKAILK